MRRRCLAVSLVLSVWGCGWGAGSDNPDASVPVIDASVEFDACPVAQQCVAACCGTNQLCAAGTCVTPACAVDEDCQQDSYCDPNKQCIPYGTGPRQPPVDPTCTNLVVIGIFAPAQQCAWPVPGEVIPNSGHINVYSTPMVADFDFDGNPAAIHPSIVFTSSDTHDGGTNECVGDATHFGVIRVIDGQTCATQATLTTPSVIPSSSLALGDLDGDGIPEIVGHRIGGGVVAFKKSGNTFVKYWETPFAPATGQCLWSGPSIHDLDDDGIPEVIMGATVFNGRTGAVIDASLGLQVYNNGQIPVVADIDGDHVPALLLGNAIYKWNKTTSSWALRAGSGTQGAAGFTAVGDFGTFPGTTTANDDRTRLDGIPEIVVVTSGDVRIMNVAGRTIMPPTSLKFFPPAADRGVGGPPTVADFDGDGRLEVGVAGRGGYNVFDLDCVGATPPAASCNTARSAVNTDYILWAVGTQDISSSVTGSSVFDFEGDGRAEVLYGDECFSRVYDGKTGDILYSQGRNSCTWYENPIVADVDGDLKSEVVIPSNDNCASIVCPVLDTQFPGLRCKSSADCPNAIACVKENAGDAYGYCRCTSDPQCGGNGYVCVDPIAGPSPNGKVCRAGHAAARFQGVQVIKDALDRWVDSRPIWNQHAYAVTNVNNDGTIPKTSLWLDNWLQPRLNNFRQNINGSLDTTQSPDLTGRGSGFTCGTGVMHLVAMLCNRGTASVGQNVPLTFYEGDPATGTKICTARSTQVLAPAACEALTCDWATPPTSGVTVTGVADDDGTGHGENRECHEGNNRLTMTDVKCVVIP